MATNFFDIEIENEIFFEIGMSEENNNEKLPIELFQKIEVELLNTLVQNHGNNSDDETDGPIDFIRQVVNSVREEFDGVIEELERKTFLHLLTKILAIVLSVKADSIEKTIKLIKLTVSTVLKTWSGQN